jgi:maltose O-acetyltransferase
MTEKKKMLNSLSYNWTDATLMEEQDKARTLLSIYNNTTRKQLELRKNILTELLGKNGNNIWIEPPFYCDYGGQIFLDDNVYLNFNCVFLDAAPIHIGANTFIAPNVNIYTETHPIDPIKRIEQGNDIAFPVSIGSSVWIGGGSIILPNVSIGSNTTIGAGSVVTKNIPDNVVAAGNPCKIIRHLNT